MDCAKVLLGAAEVLWDVDDEATILEDEELLACEVLVDFARVLLWAAELL